jgi:hypothetical protein
VRKSFSTLLDRQQHLLRRHRHRLIQTIGLRHRRAIGPQDQVALAQQLLAQLYLGPIAGHPHRVVIGQLCDMRQVRRRHLAIDPLQQPADRAVSTPATVSLAGAPLGNSASASASAISSPCVATELCSVRDTVRRLAVILEVFAICAPFTLGGIVTVPNRTWPVL